MAKYLTDELELQSVADAIRTKGNTSESLAFPTDFVSAIADIPVGGNIEEDGNGNLTFSTDGDVIGKMPLSVTENGQYAAPSGRAYSPVSVSVQPNLQSKTVTQNGTVTPDTGYDGLSSVVVNVSGGGGKNIVNTSYTFDLSFEITAAQVA